jgi:DNA repair protein RecN (Recombination protein N)
MLRTLHIRDFVIVDQAEIQFSKGFTVFSGETGAGKSILIDALSLALGARADAAVLRDGAIRTDVSAVFEAPSSLVPWLQEHEFDPEDGLVLRRVVDNQGRSRAFINGTPATLGQLRELGEQLVDIHGQHAHQSLLKTSSQRDLLDAQGNHQALARQVQKAWQQWQAANGLLEAAQKNAATLQIERERLEWQLSEVDRLGLQPGEWENISNEHNRLAHAQALLEGATHALAALEDEQNSAEHALNAAANHIRQLLRHDTRLQGVYDAIESARIASTEAASDLHSYLNKFELDPAALASAEQRLSAIFDAARKFRVEPTELPALQTAWREQLANTQKAANIEVLAEQAQKAGQNYQDLAASLTKERQKTGKKLSLDVTQAMQSLAMKGGLFHIELLAGEPSAHGNESVEFMVAGHAGTRARPLAKVASGGELARISLALSVIASQAARVPTLIFDEVDTGVGGAVADVVGRLLRELGNRHQVLCVTHLPQVAARGMHHYEVRKSTAGNSTASAINALDTQGRVNEVARMLGGLKITETTRKHAQEMLLAD